MSDIVVIRGLDDAMSDMAAIPRALVANLFPNALRAGADVLEAEVAARTPVHEAGTRSSQLGLDVPLVDNLASTFTVNPARLTGAAHIGFTDPRALWVEYGHRQVTHAGEEVGFTPAHPFMRPAADVAERRAIDAFYDSINRSL